MSIFVICTVKKLLLLDTVYVSCLLTHSNAKSWEFGQQMLPDADVKILTFFGRSSISKFASRPYMCTWSFQPRWIIESLVEKWVLSSDQQLPACLDAHQVGSMSAREKKPCFLNKGRNVSQTIHFSFSTFLSKCPSASSARETYRSIPLHVRMLSQFTPICLYFLIENTRHLDDV